MISSDNKLSKTLSEQISSGSSLINDYSIDAIVKQLSLSADDRAIVKVIGLLNKTITKLEHDIWQPGPSKRNLEQYQNTFKALEKLYELKSHDERYHFRIVIPVADRPQHLKQCLDSLLTLCKCYEYGGFKNNHYCKVSVLIADDSKDEANIRLHKKYCDQFTRAGLRTEHFPREQQLAVAKSAINTCPELARIISDTDAVSSSAEFSHKGASITRNITYLKLEQELSAEAAAENTLIYFIDSDQEFCINASGTDDKFYAINYFHYLNTIFSTNDVSVLTGKVVGDPPVSPSVMAVNFQQDIATFLDTIAKLDPLHRCQFHQHDSGNTDDAAYHDMADLFGFSNNDQGFNYHCTLTKHHTNADCFRDFSGKLERFFYGEHPTRKSFFSYTNGFSDTTPARTVYTGNYVIKPQALKYFIPFATLKLRMAGPVLGRILKAELNNEFVSANLPMLHNRTVESIGQSEFRAGVKNHQTHIDLGNEFIRQFYGDVMLFTLEIITGTGFPAISIERDELQAIVNDTYKRIRDSYVEKHAQAINLKSRIAGLLGARQHWWHNPTGEITAMDSSLACFQSFLDNIQTNFSENTNAYRHITSPDYVSDHLTGLVDAILQYRNDRQNWSKALTL